MNRALVSFANSNGYDLLPDNAQWQNRFEIRSESSSRMYTVAQRKTDRTWGCSCMGWKRHRTCKHLTSMMPALRQITAVAV
ncbi:MAG: hypothetical protein EOO77_22835 [Oxalobacteraceae bacterium]|nr:MAG: hypothetical protein EOO77_22835 [Oxalobacteraceae bacterium]